MDPVETLIDAPDRIGWRGNQRRWVRRVRRTMPTLTVIQLRRLVDAQVIDDVRLLRPAVACTLAVRSPKAWSALWMDVQHAVLGGVGRDEAWWLGALVYFLRQYQRLSERRARDIRRVCPAGALRAATTDATWQPLDLHPDLMLWRTRTILALLFIDAEASAEDVQTAQAFVAAQPRSFGCHHLHALAELSLFRIQNAIGGVDHCALHQPE